MKRIFFLFVVCNFVVLYGQSDSSKFYAGFRASRVLSSYPNNQFPQTEYWITVAREMSKKFPGSIPAGIWILSLYQGAGVTQLSFPSGGLTIPNAQFTSTDYNESHLTKLDSAGVKVWLQVEPGAASMDTLISIVLNRYKKHPSVIGFGIDVEWFFTNTNSGGKKLTDSMVARWEQKVRSIDTNYTLFIKHYSQSWMPPSYRGKVLFVDDSQDFTFSSTPFSTMISEFKAWGAKFSPNRSAFQFGYAKDSSWWVKLNDPPKTIGDALRSNIPSIGAVFWVDFTITKIFPITAVRWNGNQPERYSLSQNYPNPFNPTTTLEFQVAHDGEVLLRIYDMLGREIETLVDDQKEAGSYTVQWDASKNISHSAGGLASGMYFVTMTSGDYRQTRKITLLK